MQRSARPPDFRRAYALLLKRFGPQGWWPAETPFEVMVGAVLTQNTNWGNVERAIANLKDGGVLSPQKLLKTPARKLRRLIRPAGYFRVKERRLRALVQYLVERWRGDLPRMKRAPGGELRRELLGVNGVGRETADSILCYALGKRFFVVDAYTRRLFSRHGWAEEDADHDELRLMVERAMPRSAGALNEFHALIVRLGKVYCKKRPLCEDCPLVGMRAERWRR